MNRFSCLLALLLSVNFLQAQMGTPFVLNSFGLHAADNAGNTLTASVGEMAITILPGDSNFLSQGFLQPSCSDSICNITSSIGEAYLNRELRVFPNPTKDLLILESNTPSDISSISLFDSQGKQAYRKVGQPVRSLSLQGMPPGLYYLTTYGIEGKLTGSFKVIKY